MKYYNYIEIFGVDISKLEVIISEALHHRASEEEAGKLKFLLPR